jgi:hypothetical protein
VAGGSVTGYIVNEAPGHGDAVTIDQTACACRSCWCWYPASSEKPVCWACADGSHREPLWETLSG